MSESSRPEWFEQLEENITLCNAVTVHGNVKDFLFYPQGMSGQHLPVRRFFERMLQDLQFELIGHYDLVDGLEFQAQEQLEAYESLQKAIEMGNESNNFSTSVYSVPGEDSTPATEQRVDKTESDLLNQTYSTGSISFWETFSRIRTIFDLRSCPPMGVILYFSDFLVSSIQQMDQNERQNMILLEKIINSSRIIKGLPQLLLFVVDDISKVPPFLYLNNARCRQVYIPNPSKQERKLFLNAFSSLFYLGGQAQSEPSLFENLAAYTEGLSNYDLNNLHKVSQKHQIPVSEARHLVKRYKFGQSKSPWDELSRERILGSPWKRVKRDEKNRPVSGSSNKPTYENVTLSLPECLRERVIGQDHAVEAIETMVIRAVQGVQSSKSGDVFTKPKGMFLFCGPTGVGKTELTKAFTEWMFGDESFMLRFDMSEFNQEHSDQKLIGAPPGYVGHEQGGQLTNAVKKRPFCVILFDEVDKMHNKIWDIFLQILEDGRLTDGIGDTVYFSETVIIMTSNIGGATQPKKASGKNAVKKHYINQVRMFFRDRLQRPEILNRIGINNVIAFNPIEEKFQNEIIQMKLNTLKGQYLEKEGIHLEFDESIIEILMKDPEGFQNNGARGVENLISSIIINPFAKHLFYQPESKQKQTIRIGMQQDSSGMLKTVFS